MVDGASEEIGYLSEIGPVLAGSGKSFQCLFSLAHAPKPTLIAKSPLTPVFTKSCVH